MSDHKEPKFHRDKAGKIQLIIDTFKELINEKGYPNVSTNLIAQRAGISIGTVYNYFDNKADILQASFEDISTDFMTEFNLIKMITENDYEIIQNFITKYLREHQKYYNYHQAYDQAIAINNEIFIEYQESMKRYISYFIGQIKQNITSFSKIEDKKIEQAILVNLNIIESMVHYHLFRTPIFANDVELIEYLTHHFQFTIQYYLGISPQKQN